VKIHRFRFEISDRARDLLFKKTQEKGRFGQVGPKGRRSLRKDVRIARVLRFRDKKMERKLEKIIKTQFLKGSPSLFKSLSFDRCQIALYERGSFYSWHQDSDTGPSPRVLSFVALIWKSSNLRGGSLEILMPNGKVRRPRLRAGDAVIFPSQLLHRVVPVRDGERLTLTIWIRRKRC